MIAFTYGFVSHQVADISWHSLGIDQGFIRAMANVNFHAVFGDAHDVADIGGDMMSQLQGDDSQIDQFKWYCLKYSYKTCSLCASMIACNNYSQGRI